MNRLLRLQAKKEKLIVGLMSGTSVDGINAILVRVRGSGARTKFEQLSFRTYPYPRDARRLVLRNSVPASSSVEEISRLNILLGELFADAAIKATKGAGYRLQEIDLIGSHGQTVSHLPHLTKIGGKQIRATLQIGDPSVIAKKTGVVTVGDFRMGDIGVGGEGAPLVPYVDFILFRSSKKSRALLNIGGIANITVLPRNCGIGGIRAFDTGPGNMVIDALMKRFYHKPYDRNGKLALQGKVSQSLLHKLASHPFVGRKPPKSTGREEFGESFFSWLLRMGSSIKRADLVATAADFTAYCVYENYRKFIQTTTEVDELIISGGGAHNEAIMSGLRKYFEGIPVRKVDEYGVSSDAKEALCFALLANETVAGNAANLPAVTGAREATVLGKICL
jgi:anhydro-N-acetylmuramic acid kinase